MRIQCPKCQALAEVTRFTTVADPPRVEFRCTVCGAQITEAARAGPDAEPRPEGGEGLPLGEESGAPVEPGSASSRPTKVEGSDALWNGWDRVTERFEDASRHDAFLVACEVADELPFAAARYRAWAESHPEDPIAVALLQRIAALAQVKVLLTASRPSRERDPVRQAVILGLLLLLLLAVVVITAPLVFRGVASPGSEGEGGLGPDAERRRPAVMEPPLQNLKRLVPTPAPPRGPRGPEPQGPVARPARS